MSELTPADVEKEVIEVLKICLETKNEIQPKDRLKEDLGANSLDLVEIAMELEDRYKLQIPDEELEKVKTVANVFALVKKKLGINPI